MRCSGLALLWLSLVTGMPLLGQQRPAEQAVTVAYFYKVRWGYQEEFVSLYNKNHRPVLEAQLKSGRLLDMKTYTPRFHGDGRSEWTFMVVLVFKDWATLADSSASRRVARDLFPDQETFEREEQRRFELLEAHWDVPLSLSP